MSDNRGQRDFSPCPFACSCGLDAGSGEDLIEHLSHFVVGGDRTVDDISGLLVDLGINAIDLDAAVGIGLLRLGGLFSNLTELRALGVGHQALASLSRDEVVSLLARVGQVAVLIETGEVAGSGALDLVGLTADIGLFGSGDIQAVALQLQDVAVFLGDVDLDLDLIASMVVEASLPVSLAL